VQHLHMHDVHSLIGQSITDVSS